MSARVLLALVLGLVCIAAHATQQRSFVASTGLDTNACTLTAPCRSFAAAIGQTSDDGEVIVLDSAGYGTVTVNKSVKITAPPGVYAGITLFSGNGVTVDGLNIKVSLIGLTIVGLGGNNGSKGISIVKDAEVAIERCRVSGVSIGLDVTALPSVFVRESTFTGNHNIAIHGAGYLSVRDTIVDRNSGGLVMNGGTLSLVNSTVSASDFSGLFLFPATVAAVDRSVFHGNALAGIVVSSTPNASLTLTRSLVERNGNVGMEIDGFATVTDTVVAHNVDSGVLTASAGARVTLEGARINDNGNYGIRILNGVVQTLHNNAIVNNAPGDLSGILTPLSLQ